MTPPASQTLTMTAEERDRRQAAVNYARGTVRLEGFTLSEPVKTLFAQYASGELDAEEIMRRILRLHGK